jgi:predicted enzyme related to lactoylglutathione lyase
MFKVSDGTPWIISCSRNYDETVSFFHNVMKLKIKAEGKPETDKKFSRYTQFDLKSNTVLEVVEPLPNFEERYSGPVVSITVDNVNIAKEEMERMGTIFLTDIFSSDGFGWSYFKAPDGNVYQIQGSV